MMGAFGPGELTIVMRVDSAAAAAGAKQAADSVNAAVRSTAEVSTESTGKINQNILSNRETTRLLSEELGVHLPRAVTGAIGEILPSIASMGTALLGVFAVKEAWAFYGALKGVADAANAVAESEKAMKKIGDQNVSLLEEMAKKEKSLAREEATRFLVEAAGVSTNIEGLKNEIAFREAWGAGLGMAINKVMGKYKELNQLEEKQMGLVDLAAKFNKIFADDTAADSKRVTDALKKENAEWEKHKFLTFGPTMAQLTGGVIAFTKATQDGVAPIALWDAQISKAQIDILPLEKHMVSLANATLEANHSWTQNTSVMEQAAAAAKKYKDQEMQILGVMNQELAATRNIGKALKATLDDELKSLADYLAKEADMKAVEQIGFAASCFAAQDYVGGAEHLAAAAAWAALGGAVSYAGGAMSGGGGGAGAGSRASGGSSANTGGNQSSYGGAPGAGGGGGGAGGGAGGGGGSKGPTIIWHQYGPTGNMADFARTLAGVQNAMVGQGQIKIVATNALTNGPKQT